jgi:hypothetical protein
MNFDDKPFSYGIRQAIRDSTKTTYEIGKLSGVSAQNLYRFLNEGGTRGLSQKSLESLGFHLKLTLVNLGQKDGKSGFPPLVHPKTRKPLPVGTPLTDFLRLAFESTRKPVPEIANAINVSPTQLYRFLDGSRGLSQEKLDKLCSILRIVVEGPTDAAGRAANRFAVSRHCIPTRHRKTYYPPSPPISSNQTGIGQQPKPEASPPTIYSPPEDTPIDES